MAPVTPTRWPTDPAAYNVVHTRDASGRLTAVAFYVTADPSLGYFDRYSEDEGSLLDFIAEAARFARMEPGTGTIPDDADLIAFALALCDVPHDEVFGPDAQEGC